MKINSINTNFSIYKNLKQRTFSNKVRNDVFVKTEQISFGKKKKSRIDIINDFAKNVKKYYFDNDFDINEIQKLVQKDVKDVSVKDFKELKSPYPLPSDFMGAYTEEIDYDKELDLVSSGQKTLYLKNPKDAEYTKIAYYANCVHEFTHLVQNADPQLSAVAHLNKLIKKSKAPVSVKEQSVILAPEFAIEVEKAIKKPIHDSLNNTVLFDKYWNKRPTVTEVYKDNGIDNIKKFANSVMNEKVETFTKKYGELDPMILKEYSLMHLQRENEAYQVDFNAHKKINPKIFDAPYEWDKVAKVQLYRILADLKI